MTVFDVYVNDRKICRAGVGRDGVLTTILNWVKLTGAAARTAHGHHRSGQELRLHVGGLRNDSHLSWSDRELQAGDRVAIVINKSGTADRPARTKRANPALVKRQQRAYYQRLKEQFEPPGTATRFLNVDLDLWSKSSLEPLLKAFGRKVIVLHAGEDGREHRAHLELASEGKDPDLVVRRFVELVERLPRPALAIWNRARVREFNIGIQGGVTPYGFDFRLEDATVRAVARANARIGMTIYSAVSRKP